VWAACHCLMPGSLEFGSITRRSVTNCDIALRRRSLPLREPHFELMDRLLHVLVVDDEPRIRTMLRRYLEGEGFKVSDAANGVAMRERLEGETVDLVLLDLMMPGEDGLTLARAIRQRSEIPIIMLSGKGELIDRVVGLETGADDYITK